MGDLASAESLWGEVVQMARSGDAGFDPKDAGLRAFLKQQAAIAGAVTRGGDQARLLF